MCDRRVEVDVQRRRSQEAGVRAKGSVAVATNRQDAILRVAGSGNKVVDAADPTPHARVEALDLAVAQPTATGRTCHVDVMNARPVHQVGPAALVHAQPGRVGTRTYVTHVVEAGAGASSPMLTFRAVLREDLNDPARGF